MLPIRYGVAFLRSAIDALFYEAGPFRDRDQPATEDHEAPNFFCLMSFQTEDSPTPTLVAKAGTDSARGFAISVSLDVTVIKTPRAVQRRRTAMVYKGRFDKGGHPCTLADHKLSEMGYTLRQAVDHIGFDG